MEDFWNRVLTFAQSITETVGAKLLEDFGHAQADLKDDGSLVTRASGPLVR